MNFKNMNRYASTDGPICLLEDAVKDIKHNKRWSEILREKGHKGRKHDETCRTNRGRAKHTSCGLFVQRS